MTVQPVTESHSTPSQIESGVAMDPKILEELERLRSENLTLKEERTKITKENTDLKLENCKVSAENQKIQTKYETIQETLKVTRQAKSDSERSAKHFKNANKAMKNGENLPKRTQDIVVRNRLAHKLTPGQLNNYLNDTTKSYSWTLKDISNAEQLRGRVINCPSKSSQFTL